MGAGYKGRIRHIHNVHHCPHNVAKLSACLGKSFRHSRQGSSRLYVRVSIEMGRAGCGARDEDLVSDPDRTRVAVGILVGVAR